MSLASSTSKTLFATSCKSTSPTHAVVRINDITNSYQRLGSPLAGHALTITRIAFQPPDDKLLLSVSRDRTWRLFERQAGEDPIIFACLISSAHGSIEEGEYTPIAADKSHSRIIWDCAWAPEGDIFVTASRDKTVRIWLEQDSKWGNIATIKTPHPATAVAFSGSIGHRSGPSLVFMLPVIQRNVGDF